MSAHLLSENVTPSASNSYPISKPLFDIDITLVTCWLHIAHDGRPAADRPQPF